jgi:hypothetical protein
MNRWLGPRRYWHMLGRLRRLCAARRTLRTDYRVYPYDQANTCEHDRSHFEPPNKHRWRGNQDLPRSSGWPTVKLPSRQTCARRALIEAVAP